jgi:hypothetical protein
MRRFVKVFASALSTWFSPPMVTSNHGEGETERMRRWTRIAAAVVIGTTMTCSTMTGSTANAERPAGAAGAAGSADASRFVPVSPRRIYDSRTSGTPGAASSVVVGVGAPFGVPLADITAAVINVTATDTTGPGFVTVYPAGTPRPTTSTLNVERADQNLANLATVRTSLLESGPAVEVYTMVRTDLVIDVTGFYVRATGPVADGRYVSLGPVRLDDTRDDASPYESTEIRTLDLTVLGVPSDAVSAVLNLTAVDAPSGYWTVFPADEQLPTTSSLNVSRVSGRPDAGAVVANQVISRLSDGQVSVFSQSGGDLVIDVFGYYTGASAAADTSGRFVPVPPARVLDTRSTSQPGDGATTAIAATTLAAAGVDLPAASAVAVNLTATNSAHAGFLSAHAAGQPRPQTSNLNLTAAAQTIANHAIVPVSTSGASVYVQARADVVADLFGWFTGTPSPIVVETPSSSGTPDAAPESPTGPHEFLYSFGNGTYARWDPCDTISYRVNPANVSADVVAMVPVALQRITEVSGLSFQSLGTTSSFSTTPDIGTDAVIAFPTSAQQPQLTGTVVGLGGGRFTGGGAVVSGFAFVRADSANRMTSDQLLEVLLHEIGHMVGLAHVYAGGSFGDNPDPSRYTDWGAAARMQTMYPILLAPRGYASGDREGLIAVGASKGCLSRRINVHAENGPGPLYTAFDA